MLSIHLRPIIAKWHRTRAEDSRDGADEFRGDLAIVRTKLWEFAVSTKNCKHVSKMGRLASRRTALFRWKISWRYE